MENNSLTHWGVKGMKWGVRRYQTKDGYLTDAGRKRYLRDAKENPDKYRKGKKSKEGYTKPDADRWVKEDLTRTRKLTDESATMANKLKNANDAAMKRQPKAKMDLSNMSDKEMRDQINRALLERQYNDMFAPQNTSRGREYASQVLETAGTVLAIGSSALGIALAIKELRG